MNNPLLDITPHKVSRNLQGYSVLFYGMPKSGKTTIASKFPGALLLAFERGYSTIPGVRAQNISTWGEAKKTLALLKDKEVQKLYQTIIIDTADIAYALCEQYICNLKEVDAIGDIGYGAGYKAVAKEFDEYLRKILQIYKEDGSPAYGLVLISHSIDKTFKDAKGNEYNQIVPTLDNKARLICERTCDIIGYSRIVETEGGNETRLFMRATPRFIAGSRFKYTPDWIPFNYTELTDAIANAIEKESAENGNQFITDDVESAVHSNEETLDFVKIKIEVEKRIADLMDANKEMRPKIVSIVSNNLGTGKKISNCSEQQVEQLDLILSEIKELA